MTTLVADERTDLLTTLARHRGFLLHTARGLTDEQAASTPTVSALSIGGLIKHVRITEEGWVRFAVGGAEAMMASGGQEEWADGFRMLPGETLAGLVEAFEETGRRTEEVVRSLDLGAVHALPVAPWFEPGGRWSVRRVLLHLIAETAQHAGHADIIRESIDGQKTMG